MIQLRVTILLIGILCTPVFGADSAKDRLNSATSDGPMPGYTWEKDESAKGRLKSVTDGPMPGYTWEKDDSAKGRLKSATDGPMPGYTWEKPSPAKNKLKEATEAAPSYDTYRTYIEDTSLNCSFLTKPLLREDGGGTNAHQGGSNLCHLGRHMWCVNGYWRDKGPCDWPEKNQAYWVEGSPPPGTPPREEPEGPGGGSKAGNSSEPQGGQSGGGGAAQGGQSVLLGENPREQQLEKERQQLMNEVQQLRQLQQGGREGQGSGATPQQGQGNPEAGATNRMPLAGGVSVGTCAQVKEALSEIDRMKREIEAYSRATTTVPGAIHHTYAELYQQLVSNRPLIEQKLRENNCN